VAFIVRWTEVVAQRTGNEGSVKGESPAGHEVGNNIAMVRSPCELEWGKREKEGTGFARHRGARATHRREKNAWGGGVWCGNGSENRELTSVLGKEGRTVQGAR
jgi:hypothetical protein